MKKLMLAANKQPDLDTLDYPVMVSPKLDGIRGCVQEGKLVSRSLKDSLNRYVTKVLSHPDFEGLDGEITLIDDPHNFNANSSAFMTQSGEPGFIFHVFDDIRYPHEPALERARRLIYRNKFLPDFVQPVMQHLCDSAEQVRDLYDQYRAEGYEGVIIKAKNAQYKHGRSTLKQGIMLKLKPVEDSEAKIIDFEELMHNEDAGNSIKKENLVPGNMLGALVVEWKGKTFKIGTGFDHAQRREIWHDKENYRGKLAKFKFMELTPYGIPRGPVYLGIRHKDDL